MFNLEVKSTKRLLIGLSFLFSLTCSLFEPKVKEFSDLEAEILQEVNNQGIPSLAAWVVEDDSIVWQKFYGYADINNQIVADSNTIYGVASLSKLVVVTSIMQLQERGLLDLDSDINNYLPFAVRNPHFPEQKITPNHLLTHTSGLAWPVNDSEVPGIYDYYPLDSAPLLNEWLPQYILPHGEHYVPAVWKNYRPGEHELYSNIGATLLAYMVEVISGMDYNEYCKENIFYPLAMFNTSYAYADLNMNNVATQYIDNSQPIGFYRQLPYPGGGLKTTIGDFSHFIIAYMNSGKYKNQRILEENTVNDILQIRNPASGLCLIWNCTLGNWYGHSGGMPGVAAYVEFNRDRKVALMVVSNYRHNSIYPRYKIHALVRRIANQYL